MNRAGVSVCGWTWAWGPPPGEEWEWIGLGSPCEEGALPPAKSLPLKFWGKPGHVQRAPSGGCEDRPEPEGPGLRWGPGPW